LQREKLLSNGLNEDSLQKIENTIVEQIEKSIRHANLAPFTAEADLYQDVYL